MINCLRMAILISCLNIHTVSNAADHLPLSNIRYQNVKIGQIIRDCVNCPDMVAVPQVGHKADDPGKIFYAGRYEVTWKEYLFAVRDNACPIPHENLRGVDDMNDKRINDNFPLLSINPDIFQCYLKWIKSKTGKDYRIPNAVEWEHIARSGKDTEYYWGNELGYDNAIVTDYFDREKIDNKLNDRGRVRLDDPRDSGIKFKSIYPVGQLRPNQWGLYDVIGNASELTTEQHPDCSQASRCNSLSARGNDRGRLAYPLKPNPPIVNSLMTTRFKVPAHAAGARVGFRLIRN